MITDATEAHDWMSKYTFLQGWARVAAEYEFYLADETAPSPLRVKIFEHHSGSFEPVMSHHVQPPDAAGPDRPPFRLTKSEKDAVTEALAHGLMNYVPGKGCTWHPNENYQASNRE